MENFDDDYQGEKHKMQRQTSSKSLTKSKKKEPKTSKAYNRSKSTPCEEPIEMLTPKQNGYVDGEDGENEEEKYKQTASIKGMWKKAFKSLKSNDKQTWLSKKSSIKRKDSEPEEEPQEVSKEIDPVYSLLKCAADLPKAPKSHKDGQCSGHLTGKGDSSESTSKASSPSSSGAALTQGHPTYSSQHSIEAAGSGSPTSPTITNREHMHHIVDETLGSEFRTFYRLTSPVKKHWTDTKKHSHNTSFENY